MCYCNNKTKCDECHADKGPAYLYEVYYTSYIGDVPVALCTSLVVAEAIRCKFNAGITAHCEWDKAKVAKRVIINNVEEFKR